MRGKGEMIRVRREGGKSRWVMEVREEEEGEVERSGGRRKEGKLRRRGKRKRGREGGRRRMKSKCWEMIGRRRLERGRLEGGREIGKEVGR